MADEIAAAVQDEIDALIADAEEELGRELDDEELNSLVEDALAQLDSEEEE